MNEAVTYLAKCRQYEAEDKAAVERIEAAIRAEYGKMLDDARHLLGVAKADVADAEDDVRKLSLAAYVEGGKSDKKPHPAVQIKTYTVLEYDEGDALDYCREHLPNALKLDKRAFEKVAKVAEPEFVAVKDEDRATIARDLSEWL